MMMNWIRKGEAELTKSEKTAPIDMLRTVTSSSSVSAMFSTRRNAAASLFSFLASRDRIVCSLNSGVQAVLGVLRQTLSFECLSMKKYTYINIYLVGYVKTKI